jgi:hypothetical protein
MSRSPRWRAGYQALVLQRVAFLPGDVSRTPGLVS